MYIRSDTSKSSPNSVPRRKRTRYRNFAVKIATHLNIPLNPDDWEAIWKLLDQYAEPVYLYAVLDKDAGLIKFGRSINPGARVKGFRTGNTHKLTLLAFCPHISPFTEREVHTKLSNLRVSGEWFKYHTDTRLLIEQMRVMAANQVLSLGVHRK